MATIEQLYKDFGVLADAKEQAGEHKDVYRRILSATKAGPPEKRLACQFIPRFFKYFNDIEDEAIDAHLDLCEDDDVAIRKQAIKHLPVFCKENVKNLAKISDILTQLLQSEDATEISIVQQSLVTLFNFDAKGTLGGLFSQILQGDEVVRERAISFLSARFSTLPPEVLNKDLEEFFVEQAKKVLQDVTGDEFVTFIKLLSGLELMSNLVGRKQLVDIVADQAEIDKEFDTSDPDNIDRLIQCSKQALPFFSKNVQSTKFVAYLVDNVVPIVSSLKPEEESVPAVDLQLEVFKLLAEMSSYCHDLSNPEERLAIIYDKLVEYMPLPPSDENSENKEPEEEPKLQFSYVECLMFTFHELGKRQPEFLIGESGEQRLKDFKARLQYFARGVQLYIKQLKEALQGKTGQALKTEDNKLKVAALKVTTNIYTLVKDLLHIPPSYKSQVTLSWKPLQNKAANKIDSPGEKRAGTTPIKYDGPFKKSRPIKTGRMYSDQAVYSPPTGKYSDKAGHFAGNQEVGRRGRGFRRGFRGGRGRGRGYKQF